MQSNIPPLYFLFFFFFFFIIFVGTNNGNTITSCPSLHDCGNGVKISYPFWPRGLSYSSQYCGYQGFGLECSNEGAILILPPYTYYYIKNINYTNRTVTIVDYDIVGKDENHCAKLLHNVTLNTVPLLYSPSVTNLSFYSNCIPYGNLSYVECLGLGSGGRRSYVSAAAAGGGGGGGGGDGFDNWYGRCEKKIVAPVMKSEMVNVSDDRDLIGKYGVILNAGFDLNWHTAEGCNSCEVNHGRCGYSYATGKLLCFCKDGSISNNDCTDTPAEDKKESFLPKLLIGLGAAIIGLLFISIGVWCFLASWRRNRKNDQNIEDVIRQHGTLAPKRYTYSEIKKITDLFRDKLGQGGYGGVYKGKLLDGRLVAVKVLKESKGNGEEFINEVASISKTSHVNVVTLLGFCFEGPKRALVYEFMPNGSLEKFIHDEHPSKFHTRHLGWEALYQIAIGIARGLEYLHRGCNTRILHFDIKPHNILLDEDFCPKIADFGLAKLCPKKESILSAMGARGTIGYIAPEVFYRNFGGVSHKSDVYSYGMMILEMFGGRKNIINNDVGAESQTSSELYFPHCIYKRLVELDNNSILEVEDEDDHVMMTEEENKIVRKMLLVGLWCIQTDPSQRPSIGKVMEMLEGSTEPLQIPPEPFLPSPPTLPNNSFSSSTTVNMV